MYTGSSVPNMVDHCENVEYKVIKYGDSDRNPLHDFAPAEVESYDS